jgi:hypothetical protein
MAKTLSLSPSRFHHWNNGITVVCDEVVHASPAITLRFEDGSGICNGGHTYFSIVTFPSAIDTTALVHIEAIELPQDMSPEMRRVAINDIARYRNANRALAPTTQADFLGYYKPFQDALGADATAVKWHEGDSNAVAEALPSETLIRMLAELLSRVVFRGLGSGGVLQDSVGENFSFENKNDLVMPVESSPTSAG